MTCRRRSNTRQCWFWWLQVDVHTQNRPPKSRQTVVVIWSPMKTKTTLDQVNAAKLVPISKTSLFPILDKMTKWPFWIYFPLPILVNSEKTESSHLTPGTNMQILCKPNAVNLQWPGMVYTTHKNRWLGVEGSATAALAQKCVPRPVFETDDIGAWHPGAFTEKNHRKTRKSQV